MREPMPTLLWEPPAEMVERAVMTRYMREHGHTTYDELWRWSVDDLEGFWASIWRFFGVEGGYERVLASADMPGAEWFPGARGELRRAPVPRQGPGRRSRSSTPPSCASRPR